MSEPGKGPWSLIDASKSDPEPDNGPWSKWCWACETTHWIRGQFCGCCGTKQWCGECSSVLCFGRSKYCTGCGASRPKRLEKAKSVRHAKRISDRKSDLAFDLEAKHDDERHHLDHVSILKWMATMFAVAAIGNFVVLSMVYAVLHSP